MPKLQALPPRASSLTSSMRDLGYSLETAIADIIDNSITAGADRIEIICDLSTDTPVLAIADNGCGMTSEELIEAMRHGALDPRQSRSAKDLGRFGLGLKTASFSQCRKLTVIASKSGVRAGAEWDLGVVDRENDWLLGVLDDEEIEETPYRELLGPSGTLVVWQQLDRLFESETGHTRDEIVSAKLTLVERHLALVFHRFLAGEIAGFKKLSITLNGHPVASFDPFCRFNRKTQTLAEEVVYVGETPVKIQPYILPHHSNLSASEYDYYQNRSDFISNQGAYVYRNGRLMAWGDWFRLIPKGEATKLARVQIDFPNSLDELWTIDIKKSRASPPRQVRERLRQIISRISGRSTNVHRKRGVKLYQEAQAPLWERYADEHSVRYTVNQEHPVLSEFRENLTAEQQRSFLLITEMIASSLNLEMIYSDYSTHPRMMDAYMLAEDEVSEKLYALKHVLEQNAKIDPEKFLEIVRTSGMFDRNEKLVEIFMKKEFL